MADPGSPSERIETRKDLAPGKPGTWSYWQMQEKLSERKEREFIKRGRKINRRYRDERRDSRAPGMDQKKFNLLWSNVEVLLPVLYARTPKAEVRRRFDDQDDTGRLASLLLQRCIEYSNATDSFDLTMKAAVKDRLLPGRGVARILYVPHYGEELPRGDEPAEAGQFGTPAAATVGGEGDTAVGSDKAVTSEQPDQNPLREVVFEEFRTAYIHWEDYREGPARVWDEVPWVRYRSYLTRDELVGRFGKKKGEKVNLDYSPKADDKTGREDDGGLNDVYKKAIIHEYWDRSALKVIWVAPGTPDLVIDELDDPLRLNGFYPSPDPLLATTTTDDRIPVADYIQYQDQAMIIDELTQRKYKLLRALRARGIYPGHEKDSIQRLFDIEDDAILVPVENWAQLSSEGSLDKTIAWVPIKQIADTLLQIYEAIDKEVQNVYQITGISDILRGETTPTETMGAQQLKSNFATRRIQPKQKDVATFARDLIRLKADGIATHFSAKTISLITGYPQLKPVPPAPPMPQMQMPAMMGHNGGPPMGASGGNVVPMQQGAPAPQQPPPPDPAMIAWQQQMQQIQGIIAQNAQLQKQFDDAVALLKRDAMTDFHVDIEADSTVASDEQAEKTQRVEFLQQMVPLLEQALPNAQGNPVYADLFKEITLFAVRAFPAGRTLEDALETAFERVKGMPPHPNAAGGKGKGAVPPDPRIEAAKIQQQGQAAAQENQTDQASVAQKAQADQAANTVKLIQVQGDLALKAQGLQQQGEYEQGRLREGAAKIANQTALRQMEMVHEAATAGKDLD